MNPDLWTHLSTLIPKHKSLEHHIFQHVELESLQQIKNIQLYKKTLIGTNQVGFRSSRNPKGGMIKIQSKESYSSHKVEKEWTEIYFLTPETTE